MVSNNKNILVLGLGSEILMDDGICPKLVKFLQKKYHDKQIKFETSSVGGLDILELIQGYQTVILIDSIKTRNGKPGDVYFFTLSDFKETLHLSNIHDVSFLTAIKMGIEIGINIPENISIIAIEIVEDTVFGNSFTGELNEKFQEIAQSIENFIIQFQKN
ncbi:MAG: hydrogenase maturation protease [Bacteroidales bacterium]|nr:hydrogenase maturation protease [Bacteroidales bacterium]